MLATDVSVLHALSYLVLTTTLRNGCIFFLFSDEVVQASSD